MTNDQFKELNGKLFQARNCVDRIENAKQRIDELTRFGIEIKLKGGYDISRDLPAEAFNEIRDIIEVYYYKIIDENKVKFESL